MAVGALEPQFFQVLAERAGLAGEWMQGRFERPTWPQRKQTLAGLFRSRTREQWTQLFAGSDACVTPVLNMAEATCHAHAAARGAFIEVDGVKQPAPAPRFSHCAAGTPRAPPAAGADTNEVLARFGFSQDDISALVRVPGGSK